MTTSDEYELIPAHTMYALRNYVDHGVRTGDFLRNVIANNLFGAFSHADLDNRAAIGPLVKYIYNRCPQQCWGSQEAFDAWAEHRGMEGIGTVADV